MIDFQSFYPADDLIDTFLLIIVSKEIELLNPRSAFWFWYQIIYHLIVLWLDCFGETTWDISWVRQEVFASPFFLVSNLLHKKRDDLYISNLASIKIPLFQDKFINILNDLWKILLIFLQGLNFTMLVDVNKELDQILSVILTGYIVTRS